MYVALLSLHNLVRWLAVIGAAWALVRAWSGWLGKRAWTSTDRRAGLFLTMVLDIQLLLGVILALISPLARAALGDLSAAMASSELRFLIAEHIPLMVLVVILAHVGSIAARRAPDDRTRQRRSALWFSLTTLAMLIAIPWWRPLLRLFA